MDKGWFLVETHLRTGKPVAELAEAHGVSRGWLYKLLARYRGRPLSTMRGVESLRNDQDTRRDPDPAQSSR